MTLLTDAVRSWIGREAVYEAPEEVSAAMIRYYGYSVGDMNPIYFDEAAAQAAGHQSIVAPPTMIFDTNQFLGNRDRDGDGNIAHLWDLPLEGCRLIRGGNTYDIRRPVRPDDRITVTWRLDDMTERQSSGGLAMLIVTSSATFTNHDDEVVGINTDTLIYQEIPDG